MGEETARLREEIDQTRADLTRDVDLITDRTSPARIARRRWDRVREAGTSMKERVMGATAESGRHAAGAAGSVQETAQETAQTAVDTTRRTAEGNPLAAGLLAFGVGWLVSSLLPAAEAERRAASGVKDVVREHADEVQPMIDQAKQGAQEVGRHLKEQASQSAQEVREHTQRAASSVAEEGKEAGRSVAEEARTAGQDVTEQPRTSGQRVRSGGTRG